MTIVEKYKDVSTILEIPKEDRILFIEEAIAADTYYTEEKGSYNLMAVAGNEIIEKYFHINKNNPHSVKGELIYFEPDNRTIKRDGYVAAQAKYGVHFITHKSGDGKRRFYAGHKNSASKYILEVITNPIERVVQTKGHGRQEGIVYIAKIEIDNYCCMILRIEVSNTGRLEIVTVYPEQTKEDIEKKKASGVWSDAPFGNFTEPLSSGGVATRRSDNPIISRAQYKDNNNLESDNKKLKNGGDAENIENLIKIVEKLGKIRWKYQVEESAYNGSGSGVMYDYNGRAYEIVTWNKDAEQHEAGEKTIAIGEKKIVKRNLLERLFGGIDWLITGNLF